MWKKGIDSAAPRFFQTQSLLCSAFRRSKMTSETGICAVCAMDLISDRTAERWLASGHWKMHSVIAGYSVSTRTAPKDPLKKMSGRSYTYLIMDHYIEVYYSGWFMNSVKYTGRHGSIFYILPSISQHVATIGFYAELSPMTGNCVST